MSGLLAQAERAFEYAPSGATARRLLAIALRYLADGRLSSAEYFHIRASVTKIMGALWAEPPEGSKSL